jgi:site-specific recombinase XerD
MPLEVVRITQQISRSNVLEIEQAMLHHLDNFQMERLREVLQRYTDGTQKEEPDNQSLLDSFIAAKRIEGCSPKTLRFYEEQLSKVILQICKPIKHIKTDDLRRYLDAYHRSGVSKVTVNNTRRILNSFFAWLEAEDHIIKSPMRRIGNIKTGKQVKATYSDEELQLMRDACKTPRDLAIIDLLASTGMRIGELVNLDRNDVDYVNRECIVRGKGDKQRTVYFDAQAKLHLLAYIGGRTDDNPALFVSISRPHARLNNGGVATRLKVLGQDIGIDKVHPHKFRRTLATTAIGKGMPIEQVQNMLGHERIDTTLLYAQVAQENVKSSHRRYIG